MLLYGFAAVRYLRMQRMTGSPILLAVASACALLGEAMIAVAFARNWHATWWEWHLLMLCAFGAIAYSAQQEESEERFRDLYLDETAAGKREVSVLFADLQGFTAFSEGRDPREVSEMLNAYFEVAIPPLVREQGGEIDRLMGDAIMATWGTRGDQPDHAVARRARGAGAAGDHGARSRRAHPAWPRFRAGRQQRRGDGRACVGAESGRSFTVIGDTVNVAARLEHEAPAGGMVIGVETLRALDGARVRPLGAVRVKGKRDPSRRTCWRRRRIARRRAGPERRARTREALHARRQRPHGHRHARGRAETAVVVAEVDVPDPGRAAAVQPPRLRMDRAGGDRAQEARAVGLAGGHVAVLGDRHVRRDRDQRLGQRRVGPAVDEPEGLLDPLLRPRNGPARAPAPASSSSKPSASSSVPGTG